MNKLPSGRIILPTRLQAGAVDHDANNSCWKLWLHTSDYVYGTYLQLNHDGSAQRVTVRDGYDDIVEVKPKT
jgi:hypothetical protein